MSVEILVAWVPSPSTNAADSIGAGAKKRPRAGTSTAATAAQTAIQPNGPSRSDGPGGDESGGEEARS